MCDGEHPQVTGSIPAGCPGNVFFFRILMSFNELISAIAVYDTPSLKIELYKGILHARV